MALDRQTLEAIEACRPESDDLSQPELSAVARLVESNQHVRAVYARAQAWDAHVSTAMDDVPVPADLAARLLARLAEEPAARAEVAAPEPARVSAPEPMRWRVRRRSWLAGGVAVAASLLVALAATQYYFGGESDVPIETLAGGWMAELAPAWLDMADAPQALQVASAIHGEAVGWQPVRGYRAAGVAYKLVHATSGSARLFVMKLAKKGLPGAPPVRPQIATGGRSIGYWRSGALVYVLVVDGNENNYRAFVNGARMPLA